MKAKTHLCLQSVFCRFPHVHRFFDDEFIREHCESGLKNRLLKCLVSENYGGPTSRHLPTLERRLAQLATVTGYDNLGPLLKGASDFDEYQEALAQIYITLWFKQKGLLKEIEPGLPHRTGNADILLCFAQQDVYCEVTSFQSIGRSVESKAKRKEKMMHRESQGLREGQLSRTKQGAESELEIGQAVRKLLDKTKRQLPPGYPGILAVDTTKSARFEYDMRLAASKLLPQRPHVALIGLWSWEGSDEDLSWDMIPTCFFVNSKPSFPKIGEALVKFLGVRGEVVG